MDDERRMNGRSTDDERRMTRGCLGLDTTMIQTLINGNPDEG